MSIRVFNKRWKRRIEAEGNPNDFMELQAYAFADVPEKYTGDITFKMGVSAGDIEIIQTMKQAAKVERKAADEKRGEDAQDEPKKTVRKKGAEK